MRRLVAIEQGQRTIFRYIDDEPEARSTLPRPGVITDTMPPTEQVDGVFYTSKSKFRAVGRSLGLTEVGNEKIPMPSREERYVYNKPEAKALRRQAIDIALARFRAGERPL